MIARRLAGSALRSRLGRWLLALGGRAGDVRLAAADLAPAPASPGTTPTRRSSSCSPCRVLVLIVLAELTHRRHRRQGARDARRAVRGQRGAAPARRRHRRHRDRVLPAGPGRSGVRARLRLRPRLHVDVRVGAADRGRRARGCRSRCWPRPGSGSAPGCCPGGCGAGPRSRMLAGYGVFAAYVFGLLLNLSFWPFATGAGHRAVLRGRRAGAGEPAPVPGLHRGHLDRSAGTPAGRSPTSSRSCCSARRCWSRCAAPPAGPPSTRRSSSTRRARLPGIGEFETAYHDVRGSGPRSRSPTCRGLAVSGGPARRRRATRKAARPTAAIRATARRTRRWSWTRSWPVRWPPRLAAWSPRWTVRHPRRSRTRSCRPADRPMRTVPRWSGPGSYRPHRVCCLARSARCAATGRGAGRAGSTGGRSRGARRGRWSGGRLRSGIGRRPRRRRGGGRRRRDPGLTPGAERPALDRARLRVVCPRARRAVAPRPAAARRASTTSTPCVGAPLQGFGLASIWQTSPDEPRHERVAVPGADQRRQPAARVAGRAADLHAAAERTEVDHHGDPGRAGAGRGRGRRSRPTDREPGRQHQQRSRTRDGPPPAPRRRDRAVPPGSRPGRSGPCRGHGLAGRRRRPRNASAVPPASRPRPIQTTGSGLAPVLGSVPPKAAGDVLGVGTGAAAWLVGGARWSAGLRSTTASGRASPGPSWSAAAAQASCGRGRLGAGAVSVSSPGPDSPSSACGVARSADCRGEPAAVEGDRAALRHRGRAPGLEATHVRGRPIGRRGRTRGPQRLADEPGAVRVRPWLLLPPPNEPSARWSPTSHRIPRGCGRAVARGRQRLHRQRRGVRVGHAGGLVELEREAAVRAGGPGQEGHRGRRHRPGPQPASAPRTTGRSRC